MRNHHPRLPVLLAAVATAGTLTAYALLRPTGPAVAAPQAAETKDQPPATDPARRTDEEAVRKVNADYADTLGKGDIEMAIAFWGPDADYIDESGKTTRGRDAVGALLKKSLPDLKGCKFASRVHSIKFLRPEIALVDGTLECTAADGARDANRYAIVWTKSGDRWHISSARDLPETSVDVSTPAATELQPLAWLVGDWQEQGDKPGVHVTCRWAPNKSFLLMDYSVPRAGEEPMRVRQRVGWDPERGIIHSWVFDSTGGFGDADWERDGNRWMTMAEGVLPDGGRGASTNVYEFIDANTFVWRSTDREVDGQPMADCVVKFTRQMSKEGGQP